MLSTRKCLSFCQLRYLSSIYGKRKRSRCIQPTRVNHVSKRLVKTKSSSPAEKNTDLKYTNPISELQPFVMIPILPEGDQIFDPSRSEIDDSLKFFQNDPQRGHNIKMVTSAIFTEKLPESNIPEVAFIGRSNVGKSSLLSAMFSNVGNLNIKVSKNPGHTRKLFFYQVGKSFTLVDMPGYGYNMPDHFERSVEDYLRTRRRLCRTFLLVNGETGLTKADEMGLQMMEEFTIPYVMVLTKIDKVRRHVLLENLLSITKKRTEGNFHSCFSQPFLVSSKTGSGLAFLQTFIAYVTGCIHIQGL